MELPNRKFPGKAGKKDLRAFFGLTAGYNCFLAMMLDMEVVRCTWNIRQVQAILRCWRSSLGDSPVPESLPDVSSLPSCVTLPLCHVIRQLPKLAQNLHGIKCFFVARSIAHVGLRAWNCLLQLFKMRYWGETSHHGSESFRKGAFRIDEGTVRRLAKSGKSAQIAALAAKAAVSKVYLNKNGGHIKCLYCCRPSLSGPVLPVCSVEDCHCKSLAFLRVLFGDVQLGLILLQLLHESFQDALYFGLPVRDSNSLQRQCCLG